MSQSASNNGLSVTAHVGDGAMLLAFDLDKQKTKNMAGFAVHCVAPAAGPYPTADYWLKNLLNFDQPLSSTDKPQPTDSNQAPFQSFHWIHFPGAGPGKYQYTVYAVYFKAGGGVDLGPAVPIEVDLTYQAYPGLELGFTRGYVSSQAYADRFQNKPIAPAPKSMDFDTKSYLDQYTWLGAHARKMIIAFLDECQKDASITVDVFAYDFDEPDIIRALCGMGSRVRIYQDDYTSKDKTGKPTGHGLPDSMEMQALSALKNAGAQTATGHFRRFAHCKVMVQKKNGTPVKVLTGSANFSIRGLYVQANSVLVLDSSDVAALYEQAFEQAFTAAKKFKSSPIASRWYDVQKPGLPPLSVSFAPHPTAFSLDKLDQAIKSAKSSVFFAVMEMTGGGPVMPDLENLAQNENVFSLGMIQQTGQLKLFKPGIDDNAAVASFAFLQKNIPKPFQQEWGGGPGQVIHHKFVVCDFNGQSPVVFCGSSNLAQGGETSNGDNLLAISDAKIATAYAVEAIRLYDHYRFRNLHEQSTSAKPLSLDGTDHWANAYYDPKDIHSRERQLLVRP